MIGIRRRFNYALVFVLVLVFNLLMQVEATSWSKSKSKNTKTINLGPKGKLITGIVCAVGVALAFSLYFIRTCGLDAFLACITCCCCGYCCGLCDKDEDVEANAGTNQDGPEAETEKKTQPTAHASLPDLHHADPIAPPPRTTSLDLSAKPVSVAALHTPSPPAYVSPSPNVDIHHAPQAPDIPEIAVYDPPSFEIPTYNEPNLEAPPDPEPVADNHTFDHKKISKKTTL